MHGLLSKIYHLGYYGAAAWWRAPVATLAVVALLRLAARGKPAMAVCFGVAAGWAVLALPVVMSLPLPPLERLPGAALLLLGYIMLTRRSGALWQAVLYAAVQAWWLRGAPVSADGMAATVPVLLGLWAAGAVVRRMAAQDAGWNTIAASLALAVTLFLAGGALHWAQAALVVAFAGLALLGSAGAAGALAQACLLVCVEAIIASDHGRLVPVDAAVLAPFVVWWLAPRLLPRLHRAGPALAGALAAGGAVAAAWSAGALLTQR